MTKKTNRAEKWTLEEKLEYTKRVIEKSDNVVCLSGIGVVMECGVAVYRNLAGDIIELCGVISGAGLFVFKLIVFPAAFKLSVKRRNNRIIVVVTDGTGSRLMDM